MTPKTKLIVTIAAIVTVLAIVISVITYFATTARLTVTTTDKASYITLRRVTPHPTQIKTKNAQGKYSTRVSAGIYSITVRKDNHSAQQIVTLKGGESRTVDVSLAIVGPVEPVASVGASTMVADGSVVRYINRNSRALYEINTQNQLRNISGQYSFTVIRWANANFGVGLDNFGKLYQIKNGVISPLKAPFVSNTTTTTLDVATNSDVYLSDGKKVYYGPAGANFKEIYTAKHPISVATASINSVMVAERPANVARGEGLLITIENTGKALEIEGEIYEAAWSPTGEKLLINGDEKSAVLDRNLKEVIRLPSNNVGTPRWLNDNELIYSLSNNLWRFDISTGKAEAIANTGSQTIAQHVISADQSYIYLSLQDTKTGQLFNLARIGLKGQPVADLDTKLGLILPNTLGNCRVALVNFTQPTVAVTGQAGTSAACTKKAQEYLATYKVNPASVNFSFSVF